MRRQHTLDDCAGIQVAVGAISESKGHGARRCRLPGKGRGLPGIEEVAPGGNVERIRTVGVLRRNGGDKCRQNEGEGETHVGCMVISG